jgi:hypothetical protein
MGRHCQGVRHCNWYFEIGSLLALDGKWQPLDKIRILMGARDDTPHPEGPTRCRAIPSVEVLDRSIEADKETNPFYTECRRSLGALRVTPE